MKKRLLLIMLDNTNFHKQ